VLPGTPANDNFGLALDNSGFRHILATINGVTTTFQAAGVGSDILAAGIDKITVDAGDGSDNLFVDLTNGTFPARSILSLRRGPETIDCSFRAERRPSTITRCSPRPASAKARSSAAA